MVVLKNYVKIALKVLMRRKTYTLISLVGISFTLVILIVATTLLDTVFGQSIFETKRGRTLGVYTVMMHRTLGRGYAHLWPAYEFLTRGVRIHTLENIERATIFSNAMPAVSYHNGQRFKLNLKRTDGQFWHVFETGFIEGHPFAEEDNQDARFVAVINESTKKKFFGDGDAFGSMFQIGGQRFKVVGVIKDVPDYRFEVFADVWVPLTTSRTDAYKHDGILGRFGAAVLVKNRSLIPLVKEEYRTRVARLKIDRPNVRYVESELETRFEAVCRLEGARQEAEYGTGRTGFYVAIIIVLMIGFMLLPTVNLVNINVSRILERSSEIGVRKAFGASSRTLIGQFITENIVLTMIGGAIGFVLSTGVLHLLNKSGWIPYARFQLNIPVFIYALLMILFFGLISGAYPAWKMSRLHPVEALRGGSR
jgi:putative ABC transport system permease protein